MKTMLVGSAAFVLLASASFSSAFAEAPKPAGGNTSGGAIVQRSDSGSGNPAAAVPHYELQYHYRGRHARWLGEWVLVR